MLATKKMEEDSVKLIYLLGKSTYVQRHAGKIQYMVYAINFYSIICNHVKERGIS